MFLVIPIVAWLTGLILGVVLFSVSDRFLQQEFGINAGSIPSGIWSHTEMGDSSGTWYFFGRVPLFGYLDGQEEYVWHAPLGHYLNFVHSNVLILAILFVPVHFELSTTAAPTVLLGRGLVCAALMLKAFWYDLRLFFVHYNDTKHQPAALRVVVRFLL